MLIKILLFLHLLGMAFWLGGLFTLSVWTARARRTDDGRVVAFAYGTAGRLYRGVVGGAASLTVLAGAALVFAGDWRWFRPFPDHWLFQMQIIGLLAFLVTVAYLIPNGRALARLAERAAEEKERSGEFVSRVKRQAIVGSAIGGALIYLVLLGALRF